MFDCLITLNGKPNVRACVTYAQPGDKLKGKSNVRSASNSLTVVGLALQV